MYDIRLSMISMNIAYYVIFILTKVWSISVNEINCYKAAKYNTQ